MSSGQITVLAAAVVTAVLVLVVLLTVLTSTRRARRHTDAALVAARAEIAALRERLDALTAQPPVRRRPADPDFVITTAGTRRADEVDRHPPPPVEVRQFASVALGESLVRLVSLGYGVRRALSAENRNRIAFEMRREVRRSRKDRRRELRDLRRRLREEPGQRPGPESGQEHAA